MRAKNADDRRLRPRRGTRVRASTLTKRIERRYRAALERLIQGKATHPKYAGRPTKITPSTVAREARLSR